MSDRAVFDSALAFNNPFEDGVYSAFSKKHVFSKPADVSFAFEHVAENFFFSVVYFGCTFRKFDAVFVKCDLSIDHLCVAEVQYVGLCECCSNAYAVVQDLQYEYFSKTRNSFCLSRTNANFRSINLNSLLIPRSFDIYSVDDKLFLIREVDFFSLFFDLN